MSSHVARILSSSTAFACVAVLALSACERGAERTAKVDAGNEPANELTWARTALERNPQLEVVASDSQTGVLTIRDRNTGIVEAVKLSELAAAPVSRFKSAASTAESNASAAAQPDEAPPAEIAQPEEPSRVAQENSARTERSAATTTRPATPVETKNYTIERSDGQVRVSGPGISIVSSGQTGTAGSQGADSRQTTEPIICEGRRMVHLDNRVIYVDGDAITARGGCELYITNSRIIASGTGIVVQDAVVHVSNSHVEGTNGAFDATDQAKMYVRSSTFEGVPKRTQLATVQDQGGNRWR